MSDLLQVTDLVKIYGRRDAATRALDGVSLSLAAGEYVGIMGASGSGKTTLLNCISTIDRPTSGSIQVDGQELTKLRGKELTRFRRERLGFIFQDCNLLDTLTAFENIALALSIVGTPAGQIKSRVEEMAAPAGHLRVLAEVPLPDVGRPAAAVRRRPGHGHSPRPGAGRRAHRRLDSKSARMLLERLEVLNRERGATILMVTHDAFTASCCRRVSSHPAVRAVNGATVTRPKDPMTV